MNRFSRDPRPAEDFERRYRRDPDPWNFAASPYERQRYLATLAALLRPRYRHAFEPGCSVGELTLQLAARCDRVCATDIAPTAVARARARCAHLGHVEVQCADITAGLPQGAFDLIVFSELGYYFETTDLARIAFALTGSLLADGELIAVHWLGASPDHVLHGDTVHDVLRAQLPLTWVRGERHPGFRIDTWHRP
jgi:cyclopropane fatty-acyl-phospholipid synthase-like methyltransferase